MSAAWHITCQVSIINRDEISNHLAPSIYVIVRLQVEDWGEKKLDWFPRVPQT